MELKGSEDNKHLGTRIPYEKSKKNAKYLYEDENDIIWCESVG